MRLPTNREPIHPGEILLEEFLNPLNISQTDFANHLGWTKAKLSEIIKGKRGITPQTALDLSDAIGTSPDIWINMQNTYDLWHAMRKRKPKARFKKAS